MISTMDDYYLADFGRHVEQLSKGVEALKLQVYAKYMETSIVIRHELQKAIFETWGVDNWRDLELKIAEYEWSKELLRRREVAYFEQFRGDESEDVDDS